MRHRKIRYKKFLLHYPLNCQLTTNYRFIIYVKADNLIRYSLNGIVFDPFIKINNMKKLLLLSLIAGFIFLSNTSANAQSAYKHAIGGRFGVANGVTYKTFVKSNAALDFILNFQSRGDYSYFRLTGLYEVHGPIADAGGLRYYYGGGGTLGSVKHRKYSDNNDLLVSIDGVLGLDYKLNDAPINVSLDWKPALVISPSYRNGFDATGAGLSVRFTF